MSYIAKTKIGDTLYPVGSALYGTCATAAGTAAKVVTMADFDALITGVTIHVKFTYSNSVANPTLNVNSTGAKTIYRYGTTAPSTSAATSWQAGAVVSFTYDGTNWLMNDWLNDNSTYTAATSAPGKVATASAVGTSSNYARQDHTHGIDLATGDSNGQVKVAGTNVAVKGLKSGAYKGIVTGTDDPSDVESQLENGDVYIQIGDAEPDVYPATTVPPSIATTGAVGTSDRYARGDHTHAIALATGDSNGQVKVAGTNVTVKGLKTGAYKGILVGTSEPEDVESQLADGDIYVMVGGTPSTVTPITTAEIDAILAG